MTGYELPLRAIREQIASAVDLIVHTARLKDGSRKIVNITEVYGIEDDEILTQDIFAFEQTGVRRRKGRGARSSRPGIRPTFMAQVQGERDRAAARRVRHPARGPRAARPHQRKGQMGPRRGAQQARLPLEPPSGIGRAVKAGGMVYVSSIGPVDPETGQVVHGRRSRSRRASACATCKARLEAAGSSLDKVVWANWSLRDAADFDTFNEEWVRWFPGDAPDRPGDADAAAPAPGRLPDLDRGHRRGVGRRLRSLLRPATLPLDNPRPGGPVPRRARDEVHGHSRRSRPRVAPGSLGRPIPGGYGRPAAMSYCR